MIITAQIIGDVEWSDGARDLLLPWWSFGKTVLAAAVFRLAEQGKLELDTHLCGKPYTLRQLLAHRAGVPNYGNLADYHAAVARGDDAWPVDELLRRSHPDRLLFAPGHGWSYSNIGYLIVRRKIEQAAGDDLAGALHDTVFAPMGVPALVLNNRSQMPRLAWRNIHDYDPNWVYHGLIAGTALSAARFLHILFSTSFLSDDSKSAMFDAVPLPSYLSGRPFSKPTPGTGLMIDPAGPLGLWYGHTGAGPGSVAAVYRFADLRPQHTIAAFADDLDEADIEHAVLELAGA